MSSLHPLAVHFPIAIAMLWPLVDALGLALSRPDVSRTALGLLALGVVSSLVATVTGQLAYDAAIAQGYAPEVLDTHGDPANLVPWALLAVGLLRTVGVQKLGRSAHLASLIAGFGVAAWVGFVGYSGGRLVYEQGVGVARPAAEAPR